MKNDLNVLDIQELSRKELVGINGGGPGFNFLGQMVGFISNVWWDWANTPEGKAAQQALRDFQ